MSDDNIAAGRIDALEVLVAELLVKAELSQDPANTDHAVQGRFNNLIIDHSQKMRESGLPQARVSAFNTQMNSMRDTVVLLLQQRRPVRQ